MACFNFNFLALVVSKILGGPKFTLGVLCPLDAPQGKNFCTPGEYFTISNGILNFKFLALVVSEILGGPKFTLWGPTPPSGEIFCTQSDHFTKSNCVFISTFQLQQFRRFYVTGACAILYAPWQKNFCTRGEYFTMSNRIFNLNFLALVLSQILGGPKFTLGGPMPPGRPLAEKFLYRKRVLYNI